MVCIADRKLYHKEVHFKILIFYYHYCNHDHKAIILIDKVIVSLCLMLFDCLAIRHDK